MSKIVPHLWYAAKAEEAAAFYASIIPDSHVDRVTPLPTDSPSGPGRSRSSNSRSPASRSRRSAPVRSTPSITPCPSWSSCDDQAEIDRLWDALSDGGRVEQCGWLRDRYGLSWQIVPRILGEMMTDPDRARAKRVADAMLRMVKLDVAVLRAAYDGDAPA